MAERSTSPRQGMSAAGWLVLAALIVAAVAVFALMWGSIRNWLDREEPSGTFSAIELTIAPLDSEDKEECGAVDETALARATTAVTGTYLNSDGGEATFVADHWFKGGPAQRVVLTSSNAARLEQALTDAGLNAGRVLIASRSGEVLMCGESAAYTQELAALYVTTYEQG